MRKELLMLQLLLVVICLHSVNSQEITLQNGTAILDQNGTWYVEPPWPLEKRYINELPFYDVGFFATSLGNEHSYCMGQLYMEKPPDYVYYVFCENKNPSV